jgi:hypothetical protein
LQQQLGAFTGEHLCDRIALQGVQLDEANGGASSRGERVSECNASTRLATAQDQFTNVRTVNKGGRQTVAKIA